MIMMIIIIIITIIIMIRKVETCCRKKAEFPNVGKNGLIEVDFRIEKLNPRSLVCDRRSLFSVTYVVMRKA